MGQNPTVLASLVANIEKLASVLTLIVGGIIYYTRFGGVEVVPESANLVLGALVLNVLVAFAWHGTIMQLLIFFWIIFKLDEIDSWQAVEMPAIVTISVVAVVCAVYVAIFTWKNFDEVVSRRMKYINSRSSMYEEQWKYTLGRFFATATTIFFSVCVIAYVSLA